MNGQIFISYRREDSATWARRLYDKLSQSCPQNRVFIDVHTLPLGVDFPEAIKRNVGSCDVLIAVIGKHWLTIADEEGRRRLDHPEDFVRLEIAMALKHGIWVIPVRVDGALMPQLGELPEGLKRLADRNASIIHPRRFRADLKKLVGDVERALKNAPVKWLERARHYLGAKDYAKALPLLQKAAEAGNVEAMRNLGSLYANGWGVTMDWAESHRWYQKAAEAGDIDGMRSLDAMFYHGLGRASNYAQALEWFQKAANDEDMQSMYNLGVLYEHGRGVTQDHAQARYWFQKAAQAGYPLAPGALWRLRSK